MKRGVFSIQLFSILLFIRETFFLRSNLGGSQKGLDEQSLSLQRIGGITPRILLRKVFPKLALKFIPVITFCLLSLSVKAKVVQTEHAKEYTKENHHSHAKHHGYHIDDKADSTYHVKQHTDHHSHAEHHGMNMSLYDILLYGGLTIAAMAGLYFFT